MNTISILNFGKKVTTEAVKPKKQTYSAMYKYSKSINDNESAKIYRSLDSQAKAKLHDKKSAIAEQRMLDLSEELCDEALSPKETFKYFLTQAKNMYQIAKETVLSAYYQIRR